ncbi:CGA synthase-related protein [Streptomyces griseocarneus]|nr:CGA synthase-related protein [Streptomyces griseocarneus]
MLLVSRDDELDSLLARRRVGVHLGGLRTARMPPDAGPPDIALVCDDVSATARLLELGVAVVHLRSGHTGGYGTGAPEGALRRCHRPGWLPGPWPTRKNEQKNEQGNEQDDERPTGTLAPARLTRSRHRAGALVLLSLWGVPYEEAEAFLSGALPALVREAVRRTGHCAVVCDTGLDVVRRALGGCRDGVRSARAADVDVDALHASSELFLASPVLSVLTLAHARHSPLALLPPLGQGQRDLAVRLSHIADIPSAAEGVRARAAPGGADGRMWERLDPALDDLRGAQRVARTLRQLSLAPL